MHQRYPFMIGQTVRSTLTLSMCLALVALATTGCASSGRARAERSAASIKSLSDEFAALQMQIRVTVESLDNIAASREGDLKEPYENYITQLDSVDIRTKAVLKRFYEQQRSTRIYLRGWEKQVADVEDQELKAASMKRRKDVEQEFTNIEAEIKKVRMDYSQFIKHLRDVQTALDADLNPAGITAIAPIVERTKLDAKSVDAYIDNIITSLKVIHDQIQPQPQPRSTEDVDLD
jgi:hypothetical protein